jgi:adenosine deaminase
MTENFQALVNALNLRQDQAFKLVENSITASFCDDNRKQQMLTILQKYIA